MTSAETELLSDGARLHHRVGFDGDVELHAREAIAFREQYPAAAVDAELEAGNALPRHLVLDEFVDGRELPRVERRERSLRERG